MFNRNSRFVSSAMFAWLTICLAGCQQINNVFPERKFDAASWLPGKKKGLDEETQRSVNVKMAMAQSFEQQGNIDLAINRYLEVLEKVPDHAQANHRLAVLHDKKGDSQAALKFYRVALEKDPKDAQIYCDLGYSHHLNRRAKEAEDCLRKAIALDPTLHRAHNNLGLVLASTGREDEAISEFLAAGCSEAEARSNLGFALLMQKRQIDASQQYQVALHVDPQLKTARNGLAAIDSLNRELVSAPAPIRKNATSQFAYNAVANAQQVMR